MSKLQLLAKWRTIFTGWQLGTRSSDDPEAQAVRDHREVTMILRAEVSALAMLLEKNGHITRSDFQAAVENEAAALMKAYELKFPGARATYQGMDINTDKARPWLSKFPK